MNEQISTVNASAIN